MRKTWPKVGIATRLSIEFPKFLKKTLTNSIGIENCRAYFSCWKSILQLYFTLLALSNYSIFVHLVIILLICIFGLFVCYYEHAKSCHSNETTGDLPDEQDANTNANTNTRVGRDHSSSSRSKGLEVRGDSGLQLSSLDRPIGDDVPPKKLSIMGIQNSESYKDMQGSSNLAIIDNT